MVKRRDDSVWIEGSHPRRSPTEVTPGDRRFYAAILNWHIRTLLFPRTLLLENPHPTNREMRRRWVRRALRAEYQWLLDPQCEALVTFETCCVVVGLDPDATRERIKRMVTEKFGSLTTASPRMTPVSSKRRAAA